ncbi:MAG: hypothetical protein M5R41_07855 [Bacteroidia bacterium]|nr:hypothetical protein [Bacteroidia bacterium]
METISRNIIIDLLPAYISGDASEDSRALVERFARTDPEIAQMIRAGRLDSTDIAPVSDAPADLEMKTMNRIRRSIRRQMWHVALTTASILMVPLVAMVFTTEVNWGVFDFVVMGMLIFGTGLTYVLLSRISDSLSYRVAVGVAVVAGLLLVWVNLAVGIIGSEDNAANALYLAVLFVGILGAVLARFQPLAMSRALFATAIAQMLVPVIAFIIWRPAFDDPPGIVGVFMLNAFFAMLFSVSAILFRQAAQKQ